jgi:hypothetical protein
MNCILQQKGLTCLSCASLATFFGYGALVPDSHHAQLSQGINTSVLPLLTCSVLTGVMWVRLVRLQS